jgi:hypothetical protein
MCCIICALFTTQCRLFNNFIFSSSTNTFLIKRTPKFRYQPGNLYIQHPTVHRGQRPSSELHTKYNSLGTGNISSIFRSFQSRWWWVSSCTLRPSYRISRSLQYLFDTRLRVPRSDMGQRRPRPGMAPHVWSSVPRRVVTRLTELPVLQLEGRTTGTSNGVGFHSPLALHNS